ncbi:MAG: glycoside hydrolase domain-containing protein, partial [Victivallaceae bacterium]
MLSLKGKLVVALMLAGASVAFVQAREPGAPRIRPSVPAGFKEIPYSEKRSLPEFSDAEKSLGLMLFARPITQPVYNVSIPLASERVTEVSAFATQGEYEPVTFSIYPLRDSKNLRVKVSELRCGESVIGQKDLDLRLVTEWNIRYPNYSSKGTFQKMPELLEAVTVNSFSKGQCQRYWLKVHVPQDAKAGVYTGSFTISDDASKTPLILPVKFRVLGYKLLRDPNKQYSVYNYQNDRLLREMPAEHLNKVLKNDYASMVEYGIDTMPTMTLSARKGNDGTLELYIPRQEAIDSLLAMGIKGPIPLIGGMWEFYKKYVPGGKISSHWTVDKFPENDAIYQEIEQAFRKLRLEGEAKGWPEFICCPMDEVSPASAEFSAKVFAAIRKSGMKTYITKDPTAADATVYRKYDAIDAWCSQPFAMPYEKVVKDKRYEYWTYPNHVAGEIKDRVTMQKGGRMTYGFGLWRSGYTLVVPWKWRWTTCNADQFDYLRDSKTSGCGNRIDEQGNIIPAIYWECFREGRD